MISYKVLYKVKKSKLKKTNELINAFIDGVREYEPNTFLYHVFQEADDPTQFMHVMSFKNKEAEDLHHNTSYYQHFGEELESICEQGPKTMNFTLLR